MSPGSGADAVREVVTPVADVLAWLQRVAPERAGELLAGCGFHDGQSDSLNATVIVAVDVALATVTLAGAARPVSLRRFRGGEFIDTRPGAPLAAAIAASRTPAELRDADEQLAVRRAGFDPGKLRSGEARRAVLAMVELDAAGGTPNEAQRAAFYQAVRVGNAGMARSAARLQMAARQRFEAAGTVPEDLHWQLAALLRQAGDWQSAVTRRQRALCPTGTAGQDAAVPRIDPGRLPAGPGQRAAHAGAAEPGGTRAGDRPGARPA